MPDADKLDRLLAEAGDRWRAVQPGPPAIDAIWMRPRNESWVRATTLLVAAALVLVVGVATLGTGGRPAPTTTAILSPSPSATVPGSCPVTLHPNVAPLASQTAALSLPGFLVPYGQPELWTTIPRSGSWSSSTSTTGGRFIRTFWYSDRWSIADEPSPSISVSAGRLGGGDSVTGSAAVNARSRELGDSMIVSLDLPSGGCWQITATYRDQSLSYAVWIDRDTSTTIISDATDLPSDVDGLPVTNSADAPAALTATPPGQSILVGGWLMPPVVMSCPAMFTDPDRWNVCFAIRVSPGPWGGDVLPVYQGASVTALPTIPAGEVEPVVLRVHSRDPECPSTSDCASLPVLDGVAWLGRVGPSTAPTNPAPLIGLSRDAAISAAVDYMERMGSHGTPEVVSAVSGPYAGVHVADGVTTGDRWVWVVVLSGSFPVLDCRPLSACLSGGVSTTSVVLDYVTGTVLIEETPAPSG